MAQSSDVDSDEEEYWSRTRISCEVHKQIEIPQRIRQIVDTPEFQRLRKLQQLGATSYVFPSATHTRFEHSLGVFHIARTLMLHFRDHQKKLGITDEEIYCVSAAGLLHDLGHGPFSHVFDNSFVPSIKKTKFRHEDMSIKLIRKLFVGNNITIKDSSLNLICALVSPSTHEDVVREYQRRKRGFLFEIIANERNGIDVDKFDYFLRDSRNLNLDISFKYDRLLTHCRVINDHICFQDKTNYDVQILFNTRYELFKRVYSHKTSKAVEYMLCDIMRFADKAMKITDKIEEPGDFMELTDGIIERIRYQRLIADPRNSADRESNAGLQRAHVLIHRLDTRQIYKAVGYALLESTMMARRFKAITRRVRAVKNWKDSKAILKASKEMKEDDEDSDIEDNSYSTPPPPPPDRSGSVSESDGDSGLKLDYKMIQDEWRREFYRIMCQQTEYTPQDDDGEDVRDILEVELMSLSYGMERGHPIRNVMFFKREQLNKSYKVEIDQITTLHSESKFREIVFRIYIKNKEHEQYGKMAFKLFMKQKELVEWKDKMEDNSLRLSPKTQKSPPVTKMRKNVMDKAKMKRNLETAFAEVPDTQTIMTIDGDINMTDPLVPIKDSAAKPRQKRQKLDPEH